MLIHISSTAQFFDAIRTGDQNTVIDMLNTPGFDPNSRNLVGANGLHCAARYGQDDLMPHLVRAGTDIQGIDHLNNTPLAVAASYNRVQSVHSLLLLGASADAGPDYAPTPLMIAADRGNKSIIKNLIADGADVNAISGRFEGRRNSLNYAIEAQRYDAADFLLKAGAKPWFINKHQIAAAPEITRDLLLTAQEALTDKDRQIMAPQMNLNDVYNSQGTVIDVQSWQNNRQNKPKPPHHTR